VLRQALTFLCALLIGLLAGESAQATEPAQAKAASTWLGAISGAAAASETVYAADMASLFSQSADLRVRPMLGDAGAANLASLLNDPHVDIAFVGTDALAEAEAKEKGLAEKLELVARLSPQEVHVLARADIGALSDLTGREVNFGPLGSASAVTAAALFKALGLKVEVLQLDASAAIERLKQGAISAVVIVGGKPSPLVSAIPANAGIRLLPIPFGIPLEAAYLPTELAPGDYPNLIQSGAGVATVATGMALLAAKAKNDPGSEQRVARFVATLFPRFAELQAEGRHPKWREVNLAASLPGFTRNRAAEAWLAGRAEAPVKPVAASAGAGQAPALADSLMSSQEKEALFKRFIEWQRGKER
jgi:TRAP transporter TAXI family solute receptor